MRPRPTLLLAFGARALDDTDAAAAWAQDRWVERFAMHLGPAPAGLVLSGGAEGADAFARQVALAQRRRIVEFRLDGFRWVNGVQTGERWTHLVPPEVKVTDDPHEWPKVRDRALVEAARQTMLRHLPHLFSRDETVENRMRHARQLWPHYMYDGPWTVQAVGLKAWWSATNGTGFTEELCELARVPVRMLECPREHAPAEVSEHDLVFIDLETSGVSPERCAILEIAAIRTSGDGRAERPGPQGRFHCEVEPFEGARLEPRALAVTGLADPADPTRLRARPGALTLRRALERLAAWLPQPMYAFAGYNARFDQRFLALNFQRVGLAMPPHVRKLVDVMEHGRALHKARKVPNFKLETLMGYYGLGREGAHSAMVDIERTVQIYRIARGFEPGASPPRGGPSVDTAQVDLALDAT